MRIAIATVQVPFIRGGAEILASSLNQALSSRGFESDIVSIPFKWYPPERILDSMLMARLVDIEEVNGQPIDRVIALKFPAYFISHPNKVGWILHQHRQAYELFGTQFGDLHHSVNGCRVGEEIRNWDNRFIGELRKTFTIAQTVTNRLEKYNHIKAETLYPPPGNQDKFKCGDFGDYILCAGRLDPMKRQHLVVHAMADSPVNLNLILIGQHVSDYSTGLLQEISSSSLSERVKVLGDVSEEEKINLFANCLAVYNGVYDEDYGYTTVEAFLSGKPVIAHTDAGGPLEFVEDGLNGFVIPPEPEAIRDCLSRLVSQKKLARELGSSARHTIEKKNISWDHVIERLFS
jgi:glycosyltransferase involved in cell wall biosynthesis